MNEKRWSNKDILIGILIGFIIILAFIIIWVISFKLSDNRDMVNIISIGAGLVSIVLGVVAIIVSTIQSNSSRDLNGRMNETIERMDEKINLVQTQMTNLDMSDIPETLKKDFENFEHNVINIITKNAGADVAEKVKNELSENVNKLNKDTSEAVIESYKKWTNNYICPNHQNELNQAEQQVVRRLKKLIKDDVEAKKVRKIEP